MNVLNRQKYLKRFIVNIIIILVKMDHLVQRIQIVIIILLSVNVVIILGPEIQQYAQQIWIVP